MGPTRSLSLFEPVTTLAVFIITMPEHKLFYFNGNGRAELIRFIFAHGGIKYTDVRIEMSEWATRKASIPGGKLPLLMVDDKPLPQSLAQARYAAREAGLIPQSSLEAAYCDALVDSIEEIFGSFFKILLYTKSEGEKTKQFQELFTNTISPFLTRLNKRLSERQWFAGDQVSWGDLAIANAATQFQKPIPTLLDGFPAVHSHVKKVLALPKIKEWVAKRPNTPF